MGCTESYSQQYTKDGAFYVDSFSQLLTRYPAADTARLRALTRFAEFQANYFSLTDYSFSNQEKWIAALLKLGRQLNDNKGIASAYLCYGQLYKKKSVYDTAIACFDTAVILLKADTAKTMQAKLMLAYQNLGSVYRTLEDYTAAVDYYILALQIAEKLPGSDLERIYLNISNTYADTKENKDKALEYSAMAVAVLEKKGFPKSSLSALIDHIEKLVDAGRQDEAEGLFVKTKHLVNESHGFYINLALHQVNGKLLRLKGKYEEAEKEFLTALQYAKASKHGILETTILNDLCLLMQQQNKLAAFQKYALEHYQVAGKIKSAKETEKALWHLSNYYAAIADFSNAYRFQARAITLKDSIAAAGHAKSMNLLEIRYRSEKRQKEILQLKHETGMQQIKLEKKAALVYFLAALLAGLTVIIFLASGIYRNKQKLAAQQHQLQQQQIEHLEKQKRLLVANAMIETQEEERNRFAKDLHDGVGGLLSGLKYSISNMKEHFIISGDNVSLFERSLHLIDSSIKELRRVAHNMMPETLLRFGLTQALKDFCHSVSSESIQVTCSHFGTERVPGQQASIMVYRIIQELVNNALKHAHAKTISVQLVTGENWMSINVEDDGAGFDTGILQEHHGAGWANIESRVKYLGGRVDVQSEAGKGTFITIELEA